jgi:hypothetical protein
VKGRVEPSETSIPFLKSLRRFNVLLRTIKQVLAILAVSMFAVAGAPVERPNADRVVGAKPIPKETQVLAGIVIQKEAPEPCWDWDYENAVCRTSGTGGGSTSGTKYTCTGVTCDWGCSFHIQNGSDCEFWGKHLNGVCESQGNPTVSHTHIAKAI